MLIKSELKEIIKIVFWASILAGMIGYAWIAPSASPPDNNSSVYINVNSDSQTKSGPLWANSFLTEGGGYFAGNVGIGESNPRAKLHIGGTAGIDGIMFPDGTLQTTAAN